jgi:hypothetical protein
MKFYVWIIIIVIALVALYAAYNAWRLRKVKVDDTQKTVKHADAK